VYLEFKQKTRVFTLESRESSKDAFKLKKNARFLFEMTTFYQTHQFWQMFSKTKARFFPNIFHVCTA